MQKSATLKNFKKMLAKIKKKVYYITNTTIKDLENVFGYLECNCPFLGLVL